MSALLASTAESLYWAGRHLERAENMARIVLVHGDTHVDLPVGEDVGWQPLLTIAGAAGSFQTHVGDPRRPGESNLLGSPREADVVEYLLVGSHNPSSVLNSVAQVRNCLRLTRPAITSDAWQQCNDLWLALAELRGGLLTRQGRVAWLRRVVSDCQLLAGSMARTMRRDGGFAFLRMGQSLERADLVCRVLAVRASAVVSDRTESAYDQVRAMAVLRSLASYEGFRHPGSFRARGPSLLSVLLLDEACPRSVAACLHELRDQLKGVPENERATTACTDALVHLAEASNGAASADELEIFLARLQPAISSIHDNIDASYFSRVSTSGGLWNLPTRDLPALRSGSTGGMQPNPSRNYRVTHRTLYRYQSVAGRSYNEAHLRPRETERQRCSLHELVVVPPPRALSERTDSFGNHVTRFAVDGTFDELSVTAESRVLLAPVPPPPRSMPWESVVSVLERDRRPAAREARRYRAESRLVPSSESIAAYARPSFARNRTVVAAVTDVCSRIHNDFSYEPGFTSVSTPMLDAFEARRGVCQDFAHVAVACLRSVGLAARYVSGYMETTPPPGGEKIVGADASHAWISTYIPGWGWLDLDPTNDQLVSDHYVTVAWGLDYWDVSPLRGVVEGGGGSHTLSVTVDVEALPLRSILSVGADAK